MKRSSKKRLPEAIADTDHQLLSALDGIQKLMPSLNGNVDRGERWPAAMFQAATSRFNDSRSTSLEVHAVADNLMPLRKKSSTAPMSTVQSAGGRILRKSVENDALWPFATLNRRFEGLDAGHSSTTRRDDERFEPMGPQLNSGVGEVTGSSLNPRFGPPQGSLPDRNTAGSNLARMSLGSMRDDSRTVAQDELLNGIDRLRAFAPYELLEPLPDKSSFTFGAESTVNFNSPLNLQHPENRGYQFDRAGIMNLNVRQSTHDNMQQRRQDALAQQQTEHLSAIKEDIRRIPETLEKLDPTARFN